MNRINPLHIGILLVVILLFLIFELGNSKSAYKEANSEYAQTKQLVSELKSLKSVYASKKKIKKSLQRILKLSALRPAKIQEKSLKDGIALSSESMNKLALDSLMGKILNGTYNVTKLKIKKLSDERVSFYMEIKW